MHNGIQHALYRVYSYIAGASLVCSLDRLYFRCTNLRYIVPFREGSESKFPQITDLTQLAPAQSCQSESVKAI